MRVCVSPYISEGGPANAAVHVDLQVQGKRILGKETKMRVSSRNVRVSAPNGAGTHMRRLARPAAALAFAARRAACSASQDSPASIHAYTATRLDGRCRQALPQHPHRSCHNHYPCRPQT